MTHLKPGSESKIGYLYEQSLCWLYFMEPARALPLSRVLAISEHATCNRGQPAVELVAISEGPMTEAPTPSKTMQAFLGLGSASELIGDPNLEVEVDFEIGKCPRYLC